MTAPIALTAMAAFVASAVIAWPSALATTPVAGVVTPKPPIKPRRGKPFIPVLGNWEGTENGLSASFELRYDPSLPDHPGVPKYGITQLVALRPENCPASNSPYRETLVTGRIPSEIARYGSLGLSRFGFNGAFKRASAAMLSGTYRNGSCSGTQVWHMRPVRRSTVDDGAWRLKFRDGETSTFSVQVGGRLATGLVLPQLLAACNGVHGRADVFIAASGRARVSESDLRISMRFSRKAASGELDAGGHGCPHGPFHFKAAVK
ncbi:MAG: hypothetical protein WAK93_05465 [Solirubrobacteraceae bacterium]